MAIARATAPALQVVATVFAMSLVTAFAAVVPILKRQNAHLTPLGVIHQALTTATPDLQPVRFVLTFDLQARTQPAIFQSQWALSELGAAPICDPDEDGTLSVEVANRQLSVDDIMAVFKKSGVRARLRAVDVSLTSEHADIRCRVRL